MPSSVEYCMMVVKTDLYIVQHTQLLKQTDILEGSCDACLIDLDGLFTGNILSVQNESRPPSGLYTPVSRLKIVVFTSAVRSDQTVELSFFNRDAENHRPLSDRQKKYLNFLHPALP